MTNQKSNDDCRVVSQEQLSVDEVQFSVSSGLKDRLVKMNASIIFTSYQSNLLYSLGVKPDGNLNIHQTRVEKPMGLYCDENNTITLSAGYQIIQYENVLQGNERANDVFDTCFFPRRVTVTGKLDAHDVAVDDAGRIVFVNTRFNCLANPSSRHSFEEFWRPPFISSLVDEDRCHLNGLAVKSGTPRFVTAISRSNTIDGWRDRRSSGGIVIDVESGEIVCEGLSMPHSPRIKDGDLWLLNSGTGELGVIKVDNSGNGEFNPRVFCPGFLRGLAFYDDIAVVGLSKPRYKRFDGLVLSEKLKDADSEPWCGIQIVDLNKMICVDWLRIDGAVAELYDVEIIPNVMCPMIIAPNSPDAANLVTYVKTGSDDVESH